MLKIVLLFGVLRSKSFEIGNRTLESRTGGKYKCFDCRIKFENGHVTESIGGDCINPKLHETNILPKEYDDRGCLKVTHQFKNKEIAIITRSPAGSLQKSGCIYQPYKNINQLV